MCAEQPDLEVEWQCRRYLSRRALASAKRGVRPSVLRSIKTGRSFRRVAIFWIIALIDRFLILDQVRKESPFVSAGESLEKIS